MGTYVAVGAAAVLALALVLWMGGPAPPHALVVLPADGPWESAVLDDGRGLLPLRRGTPLAVPPGRYRVTLHAADGRSTLRELDLPAGETLLEP